ncbi:glycosyltransferase [Dissulfurispira sp.]|uniref:glycosyltransferase n=1 Tax=Dissulfurispira sp. TaxID=2817609 RepID=UPI002FD923FA
MRKVLWVTSFFPPRINVATIRNVKFLKYLSSYGWEAVVITPKEGCRYTEPARHLLSQMDQSVVRADMPRDPFFYLLDRKDQNRLIAYASYLLNNIIPPDGHFFWSLLVINRLKNEIEKHKPDVVYTSCSPFSINLIGAWVKSRYKVPWVTDFRDLWTLNPILEKKKWFYSHIVSSFLERKYLGYCDVVIVNTENSKTRMLEKYPFLNGKLRVIQNGFDFEDMPAHEETIQVLRNSFLFAGSIYRSEYNPSPLLALLARAGNEHYNKVEWEIHYAGDDGDVFSDLVRRSGMTAKCITHGYLDQKELYKLIRCMSYVLLCMPSTVNTKSWIPARLYDYMGNKSRIICLAPQGSEVANILSRYQNAFVLFYEEDADIQIQRLSHFLSRQAGSTAVSEEFIINFDRKVLTGRLVDIFESCIERVQSTL